MFDPKKSSALVLTATAHKDGEINSPDGECIEFVLASGSIHMDQAGEDRDGNIVENTIVIVSKRQAKAVIRAIRALSVAQWGE